MIGTDETLQRIQFLLSVLQRFDLYLLLFDLFLLLFESVDKDDDHTFILHVFDFAFAVARNECWLDFGDIFRIQTEIAAATDRLIVWRAATDQEVRARGTQ